MKEAGGRMKLKLGLHGNWVDHREIEAWQKRRAEDGDIGPVKVATEPLPWQKKLAEQNSKDAANGA